MNRPLCVFNACYIAFMECRDKKIKDVDIFMMLARQAGHINKITKDEITDMMQKPIKELLQL